MKISEILSENNQRIDLKLSTIFNKIHEYLEDSELTDSDVFIEMKILFKGEGYELKSRDIGCCFTT